MDRLLTGSTPPNEFASAMSQSFFLLFTEPCAAIYLLRIYANLWIVQESLPVCSKTTLYVKYCKARNTRCLLRIRSVHRQSELLSLLTSSLSVSHIFQIHSLHGTFTACAAPSNLCIFGNFQNSFNPTMLKDCLKQFRRRSEGFCGFAKSTLMVKTRPTVDEIKYRLIDDHSFQW
jgi:hypothetical protein